MYKQQEEAVINRYQSALEGEKLDLDTPLPFDLFRERMNKITERLPEYIDFIEDFIAQEEANVQSEFYLSLFSHLRMLTFRGNHLKLDTSDFNESFFEVLGLCGQDIDFVTSQERLDLVSLLAELVDSIKEATNNQIKISEAMHIMKFFAQSSLDEESLQITKRQLHKFFNKGEYVKTQLLKKLYTAFKKVTPSQISTYIANPNAVHNLGDARVFIVFFTNDVNELKKKKRFIPEGEDVVFPEEGVEISQIIKLEDQRIKSGDDDIVMDMDYLIKHLFDLPERSDTLELEILKDITVQRESGADKTEISQNSLDATRDKKGELVVNFYLQDGLDGEEYVEEASDNGTGALEEVALLIPKSTKVEGGQIELTGFFGTGKYAIFEGVDRLEMITKNQERSFMFNFDIIKDEQGNPLAVKLTGIREANDENVNQGVTIRRVKYVDSTVPELDAMLSQRAWKAFTVLSQHDNFKIYSIDQQGKKQPLVVEKEILTETDFIAVRPGESRETNFGKMRVIATEDMPSQIVDKVGLRISDIPKKYLALIPQSLHNHIPELGINIQIPLPLIRNRAAFEHGNEYLPIIKKYVAIEVYKAIVYKTLTQTDPQFVFETFPSDWETNSDYWASIDLSDTKIISLAEKMNKGKYQEINESELEELLPEQGEDIQRKFLKLMLLLNVVVDQGRPDSKTSLLQRHRKFLAEISPYKAVIQADMLRKAGLELGEMPDADTIPFYDQKLAQARSQESDDRKQANNMGEYIIDPADYNSDDRESVELAASIAQNVGMEQVLLVDGFNFAGAFTRYKGLKTMFLKRSLLQDSGWDAITNTAIHESGHLLEEAWIKGKSILETCEAEYVSHAANFTHDPVGPFAEAMKYVSAISLMNYGYSDGENAFLISEVDGAGTTNIDHAMISDSASLAAQEKGGIDFNPNNLEIQTKGRGMDFDIPFDPQAIENMENMQIDGFIPVIFSITPIGSLPLFLGSVEWDNDDNEKEPQLSLSQ